MQVINDAADGIVCVTAHDFEVIKYRAVRFHGLPYCIFQYFERYTQFKAMLNEGLTGGVPAKSFMVADGEFLTDGF